MFIGKRKSRATVYHTDADCPRLRAEPTQISQQAADWHELDCCEWCSDSSPNGSPNGEQEYKQYVGGVE